MALTARLCTERERAPRLVETDDGWSGTRTYEVNTHDEALAMGCPEAAQRGSAWSAERPNLICIDRSSEYRCGLDDPGTREGGRTFIVCRYAQRTRRGVLPVAPVPGNAYSKWVDEVTQETVYYPVFDPTLVGPPEPPVANGQGMPREVTVQRLQVIEYVSGLSIDRLRALVRIRQSVNAEDLVVPALFGRGPILSFGPGEARYRSFSVEPMPEALEVTHDIAVGLDHDYYWRLENAAGLAVGDVRRSRRYEAMVWPTFG